MKWLSFLLAGMVTVSVLAGFWLWGLHAADWFVERADRAGILLGYLLAACSLGFAAYAWLQRRDIRRWLRGSRYQSVGLEFSVPTRKVTAVVIPVSPRRQQPEWIVRWLQPSYVSLLYTRESQAVARELAERFGRGEKGAGFFPEAGHIASGAFCVDDPYDPRESKERVAYYLERFLSRMNLTKDEVFVDTTGGTVPMSIGAFQAAEEAGVSTIYVAGRVKGKIQDPGREEDGSPVYISERGAE